MAPRTVCMMAVFALGLLANAAFALWLRAGILFCRSPLIFGSVSSNQMHVYTAEFGYGYVEFDLASLGPDGKAKLRSFHMRY